VKDEIFDAVCKQTGVIRVSGDLEELLDITKAFALQPLPNGNRVAVITVSGAGGVMTADECTKQGLELAPLSDETLNRIRINMPAWAAISNPVDIEPLFEVVGPEDSIRIALNAALQDQNVDSAIVLFIAVPRFIPIFDMKIILRRIMEGHYEPKPVVTHLIGFKETVDLYTTQLEEESSSRSLLSEEF